MTQDQARQIEAAKARMREMMGLGHPPGTVIYALRQQGFAEAALMAAEKEAETP